MTLSATTLPAFNLGGTHYPAQHFSAQHIQAIHIPAVHVGQTCIDAPRAFALSRTSLLPTAGYTTIDAGYSPQLTQRYWQSAGASVDIPDPTGSGFGDTNAAGFPKNQYVRPYVRADGTSVSGYWRNSPTDGLPTCDVISC